MSASMTILSSPIFLVQWLVGFLERLLGGFPFETGEFCMLTISVGYSYVRATDDLEYQVC
jgi:hypothetical protein